MNKNKGRWVFDPARHDAICNMYLDGASQADVGRHFGISRQRVEQILLQNEIYYRHTHVPKDPDPLTVLMVVRENKDIVSFKALRAELGRPTSAVYAAIEAIDAHAALSRLFRWRRHNSLLERVRELGEILGHTPTAHELNHYKPASGSLQRIFGSLANAQRRAGLTPGRPGYWREEHKRSARMLRAFRGDRYPL